MKIKIFSLATIFGIILNFGLMAGIMHDENPENFTLISGEPMNIQVLPWSFINTGTNHTVFIPAGSIIINNQPIVAGDVIGVFFDYNGVLTCGGYKVWTGSNNIVAAMGATSGNDDGFQQGEAFSWKVWRSSDGAIFDMGATYEPVAFPFFNGGFYTPNGMTGVISMTDQIPPSVSFSGLGGPYCLTDPAVTLTGSPAGGVFSGDGISGDTFSPSVAGAGTHSITYTYTNLAGFTNYQIQYVTVNNSPSINLGPDQQSCFGASVILDAGLNYQYVWSNSSTDQTISVESSGTYSVTVTDNNGCINSDDIIVTVYPETVAFFTGLSTNYCSGNQPSLLTGNPVGGVFSGPGISNDYFDPSVAGNGSHTITYTYIDGNSCISSASQTTTVGQGTAINLGVDQTFCAGPSVTLDAGNFTSYLWSDNSTDQYLEVSLSGLYSVTVIDADGCTSNDEVLITVLENPVSAIVNPYSIIPGQSIQIHAGTGFASYLWYDGSTGESITKIYPGDYYVSIEGANGCITNDTATVEFDLDAVQIINAPMGWSYMSSYLNPYQPNIINLFSPIVNELIIAKNGNGQVYWPAFGLNLIGNYIVGQGYQIKVSSACTLPISGLMVVPEWNPLILPSGWSILGYLRYVPGDMVAILAPYISNVVIVKNGDGQFYWPAFSLNMIGDFTPGQGYLILLNNTINLLYPWNGALSKSGIINAPQTTHFKNDLKSSGANMSMVIPESAWNEKPSINDEIAIVNSMGVICGSSVIGESNTGITIWGNDTYSDKKEFLDENEKYFIKYWNSVTNDESLLEVSEWESGSSVYTTNNLAIVKKFINNNSLEDFSTNCYPNPFKDLIEISITISSNEHVNVRLINSNGELVRIISDEDFLAGNHKIEFDGGDISSGVYYYQVITGRNTITKAIVKQ